MGFRSKLALALVLIPSLALGGCAGDGSDLNASMQSVLGALGTAALGGGGSVSNLTEAEIGRGLREALRVGTDRVVDNLGVTDGFYAKGDIHIPLPGALAQVDRTLETIGMNQLTQDLETRLNRAAEAAVPRAKVIFWDAIADIRLDDIMAIYRGPDDAATEYFRGRMSAPLAQAFEPIVDDELARVGAIRAYDQAIAQYSAIPMVPDVKADLVAYVLERSIDGMFLYLGREEARIREDPLARTSDILRRVFGSR